MNKLAGINANLTINGSGCDGIITGGYGKDYSGGSNELERVQTEPDSTPLPIFLRKRLYKKRFLIFTTAYLYLKRRSFSNINEKHNLMI